MPPTCTHDSDCGPPCSGNRCVGGTCQLAACTPGWDATCNDDPTSIVFAGGCNLDATCTCNPGYVKKPNGKCG